MSWPPHTGELLPRGAEATGVREKLATYSLDPDHTDGGPKARGFASILGITIKQIDHLEAQIKAGILTTPISSVRDNPVRGLNCTLDLAVRGVGDRRERVATVRTVWHLINADAAPRLITAYPRR